MTESKIVSFMKIKTKRTKNDLDFFNQHVTLLTSSTNGVNMKLINNNGKRALVLYGGKHYIVSDNGSETLIFPADSSGNVTEWSEVGGARSTTLLEVIGDFSSYLHDF
jgi:hypothetical protein